MVYVADRVGGKEEKKSEGKMEDVYEKGIGEWG